MEWVGMDNCVSQEKGISQKECTRNDWESHLISKLAIFYEQTEL